MRRRNGKRYRRLRTQMGRVYWIEMKEAEVAEMMIYRAAIVMTPVITMIAWAWAAGILK